MPYVTPHTESLHVIRNHLLLRRGAAYDVIDTGVPATVSAPSMVSDELGVVVHRLIGCTEIASAPLCIDWPARTITWGDSRRDTVGVKVPLRMSPLGVPLIPLDTQTGYALAVLDTGAALSYCPPEYVEGLRPHRRDEDFLPGYGRFEVDIHMADIEVMGVPLSLEVAVLPPLLRTALAMIAPDGWILGAALFRDRVVTLDLARSLAIIGERKGASPVSDDVPDVVTSPAATYTQTQDDHAAIACTVALDSTTLRSGETRIRAAVTLRGTATDDGGRPVDLALVLDRSGSMNGAPIEAVRKAASALVARLPWESRAAIVSYASDVRVDAPLMPIEGDTLATCQRAIQALEADGMTALAEGWRRGHAVLASGTPSGAGHPVALRRVVLMTDGLANVGDTSPALLATLCRQGARQGISTTTMGFGDHYDEDLLRAMADAGDGSTWYVQGAGRVGEVLDEELRAMRSVSALRVALGVVPGTAPLVGVWGGLSGGGRVPAGDAMRTHTVMVGELSAAAERTVVLEFAVSRELQGGGLRLAECEVTGVAPDGVSPLSFRFCIEWDGRPCQDATVRADWLKLRFAAAHERAVALADARQYEGAARLLERCLSTLDRQPLAVRDRMRGSRDQLLSLLRRMRERRLDPGERKRVMQHAYDRRTGKQTLFSW